MILSATTMIIFTSIIVFFLVIILLVSILLGAKSVLAPSGPVKIRINGEKEIEVESMYLPSAKWWW